MPNEYVGIVGEWESSTSTDINNTENSEEINEEIDIDDLIVENFIDFLKSNYDVGDKEETKYFLKKFKKGE